MNRKPQGIISYAGLDVSTLLAGARLMFTNPDEHLPRRFASLMPLFPMELIQSMPFVGVAQPGQNVAPGGFSIDPAEYHCMLHEQMPRLYVGDNLVRNTDAEGIFHGRGVVTVDEAWTTCFPQYQPFAGERLVIYPMGGGAQAVAVPQSLYPRAAGLLRQAETALGVTRRCHDYAHYVYQRIRAGQAFDADQYENDYLAAFDLQPVTISQSDLGRMMQDISMLRNAREGGESDGLYTENAKRAEHILQYVPGLYACDVFEDTPTTRYTSRLLQPMWEDGFVSDLWIPYADAAAYAAADRQTLDMTALCDGFQLAPVYDPQTRGGRYPDKVRVVIVREKDLRLRIAETLNNPAYGSGMSPAGSINRLVYLPSSKEMLRQGKLMQEENHFHCENTAVPPARYRSMLTMAALQESKGRLVDALYRRESVLSEVRDTQPDHDRLHVLMNQPVEALESRLQQHEKAQLSGYDADIDYLRRMGMEREWKPGPKKQKTFRFAPDNLRQTSIESGFAMRAALLRYSWDALALPPQEPTAPPEETAAVLPDDETQWLDYTEELTHSVLPEQPPLWLEAADARYLTTDVGGLYPTDEELSQGSVQPTASPAAEDVPSPAEEPKPKKPSKGQKSGRAAKAEKAKKAAKSTDRRFSEEELMERQVHLDLSAAEPTPVAASQPDGAEAASTHEEPAPQAAPAAQPAPASSEDVPAARPETPEAPIPQEVPAKPAKASKGKPAPKAAAPQAVPPADGQTAELASNLEQLTNGQLRFLDLP